MDQEDLDETKIEFNESIIIKNEIISYEIEGKNEITKGLNLYGQCLNVKCKEKYFVRLGYGDFEFG